MKIAVYAISKNEAAHVERFVASARDADLIVVADTGSTDGTAEALERLGVGVHHICITPWRFDDARNVALALIPRDIDVCVSLDLDEVLEPGWRQTIESAWESGRTTRLRYGYDWGAGLVFRYEKIHARHGYRWHHPCHEYPVPDRIEEVWAEVDTLLVRHLPDPTKSRGQYLDLLRVSIEEDPQCPRNAFYYARELSFHGRWAEAIVQAMRYLALPRANWANERCYAMRVIAQSYEAMADAGSAREWLDKACREAPETREPWCALAALTYRTADWAACYAAAKRCLAIVRRELVYTADPAVWGAQPHDYAAIAAWNLGLKAEALEHAEAALALDEGNERLRANRDLIAAGLATADA